jgi:hypothetical protein
MHVRSYLTTTPRTACTQQRSASGRAAAWLGGEDRDTKVLGHVLRVAATLELVAVGHWSEPVEVDLERPPPRSLGDPNA